MDCCSFYALFAESDTRNYFANYEYDSGNLMMILVKSVHITIEVESFADLYDTWRHQQYVVAQKSAVALFVLKSARVPTTRDALLPHLYCRTEIAKLP